MPDEDDTVDRAMDAYTGQVEYSLQVVTTISREGEPSGCVVGFSTQCSIVPPRFLVCISKVNYTYFAVEHAEAVALHLIGRDQIPLASLFAETSGDTVDKFSRCAWHPGVTGSPVLDECLAWVEASIIRQWSVGDHQALLVRPVAGGPGISGDVLTVRTAPEFRPGHPSGG